MSLHRLGVQLQTPGTASTVSLFGKRTNILPLTPLGRFRYLRAPQGYVSSGDGYNRRFDAILSTCERSKRCVDNTLLYDSELEEHWWRVIDFLEKVGHAGIVLTSKKLQFCSKSVDFAGFRLLPDHVEPLHLEAIRKFPTPKSTTDIRSWFGLVHQVAHYAQLRNLMEPFKAFLSPKVKFFWNEELDSKFIESKQLIVNAICSGVTIFDVTRKTCLRADWSKKWDWLLSLSETLCMPTI